MKPTLLLLYALATPQITPPAESTGLAPDSEVRAAPRAEEADSNEQADTLNSGRRHVEAAHRELRMEVRVKLIPHLRTYQSLSADLVEQLEITNRVRDFATTLHRLRQSVITHSLENTVPGFRWITRAWDALSDLLERLERTKERLADLERVSRELLAASERYTQNPTDDNLTLFLRGYQDAEQAFLEARTAFQDLDTFLLNTRQLLARARQVTDVIAHVPWIGDYAETTRRDIDTLSTRLEVLRRVLSTVVTATNRDPDTLTGLKNKWDEAHAHDAYDRADQLYATHQPGSALNAFRELRTQWPDTEWAHRADRKIGELVEVMDRIHTELLQTKAALAQARTQLAEKPTTVVQTVEKPVFLRITPDRSPWALPLWGTGLGLLALLGSWWARKKRRTVNGAPPTVAAEG